MTTKTATRFSIKTDTTVFKRLGRSNQETNHHVKSAVCKYWLEGRCTRNPCRFLHPDQAKPATFKSDYAWKNPNSYKLRISPPNGKSQPKFVKNKENCDQNLIAPKIEQSEVNVGESKSIEKTKTGVVEEKCHNVNSWFDDKGLTMIVQLEGHSKDVTGIIFHSGSNNLYCASKDKTLRAWDCNNGQCGSVINLDYECRALVEEGPWIFAGLQSMIKAWNLETQSEVIIQASGGMVNAITMFEETLFAGMEDGTILSWKSTSRTSFSKEATSLKGHRGPVLSLIVGVKKLYSGSTDHTIRVWDVESLECKDVLNGHTGDVTSVICWDQYLLSGSLDKTIKVWGATESGNIDEVYKHDVDNGVITFCGMHDAEKKPILLCSLKDNGVCLYDLPSFVERGRIYSKHDVKAIQICPGGLFFTGDAAGSVLVWKPSED